MNPQAIQCITFKEQNMNMSSPSYSPLPNLDELITSFDKLHISMPSRNSSTENLVERILDQPWRVPVNPATGEALPYCVNKLASPTTEHSSPAPNPDSPAPLHVQILEWEILALSPPPPSQPATPIVHHNTPPSEEEAQAQTSPVESSEDNKDNFPIGEGWFHSKLGVHTTNLTIPTNHDNEEMKNTKYLKFTINYNGEPTIKATMGWGCPHYALPIVASPVDKCIPPPWNDEEELAFLAETHMMGGPLNRALEGLGDYGVYADMIRLRNGRHRASELDRQAGHIEALKVFTRQ
jgi:hypothetical protein